MTSFYTARRMDMLEQRLNSSEQSNRVLMDELMRLQQDMKVRKLVCYNSKLEIFQDMKVRNFCYNGNLEIFQNMKVIETTLLKR